MGRIDSVDEIEVAQRLQDRIGEIINQIEVLDNELSYYDKWQDDFERGKRPSKSMLLEIGIDVRNWSNYIYCGRLTSNEVYGSTTCKKCEEEPESRTWNDFRRYDKALFDDARWE